jgi:hypothetical protein
LEARFDKPGYYHVLAQVATGKDAYLREDGTLIVPPVSSAKRRSRQFVKADQVLA